MFVEFHSEWQVLALMKLKSSTFRDEDTVLKNIENGHSKVLYIQSNKSRYSSWLRIKY